MISSAGGNNCSCLLAMRAKLFLPLFVHSVHKFHQFLKAVLKLGLLHGVLNSFQLRIGHFFSSKYKCSVQYSFISKRRYLAKIAKKNFTLSNDF